MITQEQRDKLREYFSTQPVEVVYLFGSQTNGKANKLSDVDLAVLFKEGLSQSERFDLRLEYMNKAGEILKMPDKTEVIDLKSVSLVFQRQAIFLRDIIFESDKSRRSVFEARVNSRYFDYEYFIKENTKYSLASIGRV